jgi:stage II sporulation protein M
MYSFKDIRQYLYEIKSYLLFSALLFIFSFCLGYVLAQNFPRETQEIIKNLESMFIPAKEMSSLELFVFILENNITKLSAVIFLGVLAGIIPFLVVFSNGLILGVLFSIILEKASLDFFLLGILPHGIIEIPVLIISGAIGLRLGKIAVFRIFSKKESFKSEFYKGIKLYVFVLVPLLFIAAFIEAFITLYLLLFFYPV